MEYEIQFIQEVDPHDIRMASFLVFANHTVVLVIIKYRIRFGLVQTPNSEVITWS